MDWFFKFLPYIMRIASIAPRVIDAIKRGIPIITLLKDFGPELWALLIEVGAKLFPELPQEQQAEIGALKTFDIETVRWIQDSLNRLGGQALTVDGDYGTKTKAAVIAFQTKFNVSPADGWAGKMTTAVIQTELNKLPPPGK